MFSNVGEYEPCGIFTIGHFILIAITILGISIALKNSTKKSKKEVYEIIKYVTIVAYILEVMKIVYNVKQNSFKAVNTYLPLYYCSILLYAGILSSFAKGFFKRIGDVSLATGSIIGGIVFLIYPSTSLPIYPAFHILSIHSFLFHGAMIYLGILINETEYIEIKKEDIKYFAILITCMSVVALIVNKLFDGNLMFISNNFPGTPIEILYKITDGGAIFTIIMVIAQIIIPFYMSYYIIKKMQHIKKNRKIELNDNANKLSLGVEYASKK